MKLSSERDDSFLELSGALFLHLAKGAHALVKHTENTECCVDESLMVESMTLANMLYTVAVLHCNPVQSKVVADRLAKFSSPGVIQGIVDMLHFCYVYNFTSGKCYRGGCMFLCMISPICKFHSLVPRPSSLVGKNKGKEGLVKLIT